MKSAELRRAFLEYFRGEGHVILPSSSLVPNDPTLLFTSAGMVQFKDIFWGKVPPRYPRVTTCQKCFRTTDLERVGTTPYHHTFFEMLGNFSFGDYFKEGAIALAWRFLTRELGLPKERLWVSVYEEDEEAYAIWRDGIGLPPERIVRLSKDQNWWGPVGNSGPCGPDTEIYWDWGDPPCGPDCKPSCDCGKFSEVWNLVFMQYDAQPDGTLKELAKKNIDTGMGLERMSAVLQGVRSNFATDLFQPILEELGRLLPSPLEVPRGPTPEPYPPLVLADHIRAVVFLVADGVLPDSEESRGSVLRKVFLRMFRHADRLGIPGPALLRLVEPVVATLGGVYPEIVERRALVERVILAEAEVFRRRKEALDRLLARLPAGTRVVPGEVAFTWYDTHGIPRDFIEAEAQEHGLSVDWEGFERELQAQRARSRHTVAYDTVGVTSADAVAARPTKFVGYHTLVAETALEAILDEAGRPQAVLSAGAEGHLGFPETPFYAEAGGQIADTGWVENLSRPGRAEVLDVQKGPHGTLHKVRVLEGEFRPGDRCRLLVDEPRRKAIQRAHTATHLLHAALRQVLGEHVIQAGSWVGPEELRFDFTHFAPLAPEELARVEELAFAAVLRDLELRIEELPLEEAKRRGAIAHFEEEYRGKERVRVVQVPGVSMELCGGTHVSRTGEIGPLVILSEESVAAGTRRIRALVGERARRYLAELRAERRKLAALLEAPEGEVLAKAEKVLAELSGLRKESERLREELALLRARELAARAEEVNGTKLLGAVVEGDPEAVKALADRLAELLGRSVVVLGTAHAGRGFLVAKVLGVEKVSAGDLVKAGAQVLGGSGGGRPTFAQGGGPKAENLPQAVAAALARARSSLAAA
ncbi:MAG: alanine--tRNA ligase [Candidatus Bipolaricaulota bacterium]|nr:alanine--tRNA ligase [Candidatus Bipolaricaulota bacterium]